MGDTATTSPSATDFERLSTAKLYRPVVLRCTLWVGSGVMSVVLNKLYDWKSAVSVSQIDVFILLAAVLLEMCKTWLTYIDRSFARFHEEKQKFDTAMTKKSELDWTKTELAKAAK